MSLHTYMYMNSSKNFFVPILHMRANLCLTSNDSSIKEFDKLCLNLSFISTFVLFYFYFTFAFLFSLCFRSLKIIEESKPWSNEIGNKPKKVPKDAKKTGEERIDFGMRQMSLHPSYNGHYGLNDPIFTFLKIIN